MLRNIFEKPFSTRPPIGTIPSYIQSEEPIFLPTAHKVLTIKNSLINEKGNTPLLIKDYLDSFVKAIDSFAINEEVLTPSNFDEIIIKKIDDLLVLRNDFLDFIDIYASYSLAIDTEQLHAFFEKLIDYHVNSDYYESSANSLRYLKGDSTKFFYYELFLTFTAYMLEKERFQELANILQTPFIIEYKNTRTIVEFSFTEFRQYVSTLNERHNKKYSMNRVSVTADKIKQRVSEKVKFEMLVEADILLYYISLFFRCKNDYFRHWFPETSCYRSLRAIILPKTISQRYFDKVKVLFGVRNKQEMVERVNEIISKKEDNFQRGLFNIPSIKWGLGVDDMCKLK